MTGPISTRVMVTRLEGLLGTKDLNDREHDFVRKLVSMRDRNQLTHLTDGQLEYLEALHGRHFA